MKPQSSVSHDNSKTIAFRVSQEDYDQITLLAEASGYVRQDYLKDRVLQKDIIVQPNIRVQHYLEKHLIQILGELQRLQSTTADEPCLHKLELLMQIIAKL